MHVNCMCIVLVLSRIFGHLEVPDKCLALNFVTRESRWSHNFFLLCPSSKFAWLQLYQILWKQGSLGWWGSTSLQSFFNMSFTGICKDNFTDLWINDSFGRAPALLVRKGNKITTSQSSPAEIPLISLVQSRGFFLLLSCNKQMMYKHMLVNV